ncbi:MAG TPA: hypothetical protein VN175_03055 [Rhizomicrobium sp.]|nr:hypothetical protein [Rhizomicrobium sp.]
MKIASVRNLLLAICPFLLAACTSQSAPPSVAPPTGGSHGAQASAGHTLDTPIEVIAADPAGVAVLNKDIPGLLANPNYAIFKGMSLNMLAAMSRGRLSEQTLAQTKADLEALHKQGAANQ